MAYLTPITQAQLRAIFVAEYQADAATPADDGQGSQFGALANATSLLATQVEENVEYALGVSRLATSYDEDVDSFVDPFGVPRLGAGEATTTLTISTPSVSAAPLTWTQGTIVQRDDGVQYTLDADATIGAGTQSTTVGATCSTAGSIGNCPAGAINAFYSGAGAPPAPLANVTNAQAVTDGIDAESSDSVKQRFPLAVTGKGGGSQNGILAAVAAVQAGLTLSFGDRLDPTGNTKAAHYTVVVNVLGQNGAPSANLIAAATNAVAAKHAAGITYDVIAPTLVPVDCVATLKLATGADPAATIAAAQAAFDAYVNNIGLDQDGGSTTCAYGRIYAVLLGVAGVAEVLPGMTLGGAVADVTAAFAHQLVAGAATFSVQ